MRIIAFVLLVVSALTLIPASGVLLLPASADPDQQVISVLDVCNQQSSGLFSGLDLPYVSQTASTLARPCCQGRFEALPSSSYVFIDYFELDYPPKV